MVSQHQPLNVTKEIRSKVLDHEAFMLLQRYNIPHPPYGLARTPEEAGEIATKIGFPVVLKVVSPDISHKTDVGGVILGVNTPEEAVRGAELIFKNVRERVPTAQISGILVQKMAPKGVEVIIGGILDPVFGITLMFGLGGVFTEVFRDVTFRVWPITIDEAVEMINEIKSAVILRGFRGMPPVDIRSIADIIVKLGKILEDHPNIETADLNPVLAYPNGALAIDARFILKLS